MLQNVFRNGALIRLGQQLGTVFHHFLQSIHRGGAIQTAAGTGHALDDIFRHFPRVHGNQRFFAFLGPHALPAGYRHLKAFLIQDLHHRAGHAAALGEALAGCAKGAESAVIITLGTGVGGGVVLGGKLLTGYTGAAAEPGHMVILDTPDAPRCTCGRPGCLESLASATALIRMTKEAMAAHPESTLHGLAVQSGGVNGRTAFDAAAQGDAAGKAVVEQYIHYLAVGVANMINIFFPEVIGLSGGVANQGENLLAPLRAAVGPMVFGNAYAQKHTRITTCTLGYRAGVIGAALLAKNQG